MFTLADKDRTAALAAALAAPAAPAERWRHISQTVLRPEDPLITHQALFGRVFAGTPSPNPAWTPTAEDIADTRIGRLGWTWAEAHRRSVEAPETFWPILLDALRIHPETPARAVLEGEGEEARWFPGMRLNAAAAALYGRDDDRDAVVWQVEGQPLQRCALGDLRDRSVTTAKSLLNQGFMPGDAWAVAMPMTIESVVIYLGIVLAGGVVISIADSFSAKEIAMRLDIAGAKGIFTQDVIPRGGKKLPLYARVVEAEAPRAVVLPAGEALDAALRDGDLAWADFLAGAGSAAFTPQIADAEATTNILFSSGTTGTPKAIPWTHLTPIKSAADGFAHHDIQPGHVVAWPTNLGWMMGPWLIYASLLNDATLALYVGDPGSAGFSQFVQAAGVTMLGVVPSLVKTWRARAATTGCDWSAIRCFSSTGEASNPVDMLWLMAQARYRPIIEYCGGTEIGGGYITGSRLQPQAPSTFSTPAIGCRFYLLDDAGQPAEEGEVALIAPLFGSSQRLLNRDHHAAYFAEMPLGPHGETLRRHGDRMAHLGGGYYRAQGRADDAMNLGGIKISSAELERAVAGVPGVHEVAAIAHDPPEGGPSQLVLVVVPRGEPPTREALQRAVRDELNPLFRVHDLWLIDALPRTASNKVMRRVLRSRYADRLREAGS
ncbi:MAG: AMP-binding protein [Myxococcales bacterium]|nr:AMP-binding protein [Myxococcales bacterium]